MTQEAAVPAQYNEQLRRMVREEVAAVFRSAPLGSARISQGRLTVAGGTLVVEDDEGNISVWFGAVLPRLPDGTQQPGMVVFREDGTVAMAMHDPVPEPDGPGDYKQFLAIYDRGGRIIFSDDTDSGQGHARPWLSGGFTAKRFGDFRYSTTSPTWETLCDQLVTKQQPRLQVGLRASMDTAGTTGEVRVLVNGALLDSVTAEGFSVSTRYFGAEAVAGDYGDDLLVEIQGQRTSASGTLRVEPRFWKGRQS